MEELVRDFDDDFSSMKTAIKQWIAIFVFFGVAVFALWYFGGLVIKAYV